MTTHTHTVLLLQKCFTNVRVILWLIILHSSEVLGSSLSGEGSLAFCQSDLEEDAELLTRSVITSCSRNSRE